MPWTIIAGRDRAQGEMGTRITIGEPEKREEEDADCICCCRVESVLDQSVPALGAWSDGLAISIRDASYFPQKNSNRLHLLRRPGSMYFVFFNSEFCADTERCQRKSGRRKERDGPWEKVEDTNSLPAQHSNFYIFGASLISCSPVPVRSLLHICQLPFSFAQSSFLSPLSNLLSCAPPQTMTTPSLLLSGLLLMNPQRLGLYALLAKKRQPVSLTPLTKLFASNGRPIRKTK